MRRLVLIFMLLWLPLQAGWAVAAGFCTHEAGGAHFGHHEHRHVAAGHCNAPDGAGHDHARDVPGDHPDCQVCHGVGVACVQHAAVPAAVWTGLDALPAYRGGLPEPPVDALLRPPLCLVA